MRCARTYRWTRMRPYRARFRGQGVFFAFQSWAGCITKIFGFDLRQAQGTPPPHWKGGRWEQQQPDHETRLDAGPPVPAVQRRSLVDPGPIDPARKLHQLVLRIDDLVEPRAEQIAFTRRFRLLRSHRRPPSPAATESRLRIEGNLEGSVRSPGRLKPRALSCVRPHRSRIERAAGTREQRARFKPDGRRSPGSNPRTTCAIWHG